MSECAKALGDCVYRYRKKRNMTQAALAESTGVTEQTIRKIEHGEGNLAAGRAVCADRGIANRPDGDLLSVRNSRCPGKKAA